MAKLTIAFAAALMLLGVICFFATGREHPTALIPAIEGVFFLISGLLAIKPAMRMHAMHLAVTIGLVCAVMSIVMLATKKPTGAKLTDMLGMAILSTLFVILCVRSFISARRSRRAQAP